MYFKSQNIYLVSFQYLKKVKRFSDHLKTVYSQIEYAESENEPFFKSEYFFIVLKKKFLKKFVKKRDFILIFFLNIFSGKKI